MVTFSCFTISIVDIEATLALAYLITLITFLIEIESKSESNADVHIFRIESNFYADYDIRQ